MSMILKINLEHWSWNSDRSQTYAWELTDEFFVFFFLIPGDLPVFEHDDALKECLVEELQLSKWMVM